MALHRGGLSQELPSPHCQYVQLMCASGRPVCPQTPPGNSLKPWEAWLLVSTLKPAQGNAGVELRGREHPSSGRPLFVPLRSSRSRPYTARAGLGRRLLPTQVGVREPGLVGRSRGCWGGGGERYSGSRGGKGEEKDENIRRAGGNPGQG